MRVNRFVKRLIARVGRMCSMKRCFSACVLGVILACGPAWAETQEPLGCTMSLFNGEDLDGWVVTGCKAGVEQGVLVLQGGDGFVRSEHDYGDFILELEWRARKPSDWDSGVYFRAQLPVPGKTWPALSSQSAARQGGERRRPERRREQRTGTARRVESVPAESRRFASRTGNQRTAGLESYECSPRAGVRRPAIGSRQRRTVRVPQRENHGARTPLAVQRSRSERLGGSRRRCGRLLEG